MMFKFSLKSPLVLSTALLALLAIGIKFTMAFTAFTPMNQPVGYVAQDDVSNYDLRSGDEILYRGEYTKAFWSGNLIAYKVDSHGNIDFGTGVWSGGAADQIDGQLSNDRLIVTMKDDGTKIPFRWANLSAAQQTDLGTTSTIVDFLRGDRTNELPAGSYRTRDSVLGDIVHSRPYFVTDTVNPTVFVGANDGMLHAINASTGKERWGYVPSMLMPKLKKLAANPYVHDYFVDGQITIGKVSSGTKRVLVGGLGAGGKGLYALDITGSAGLGGTDETSIADKILWEITPTTINNTTTTTFRNLGYTYGTPNIAKVGNVDAAIFGNGYNDGASGDNQAYLYVVNATTGALIRAIQAGTAGTAASPNGLSTAVVVDSNFDGAVDLAYAGDLNGTMWKFNLATGTATALWNTNPAQPITGTPAVGAHPDGGYMVNFGTGAMLDASDATSTSVHYVYGIRDHSSATGTTLVTQTLTEHTATFTTTVGDIRVRTVSNNTVTYPADRGWKVALPAGEKLVGEGSFVDNNRFYFTAYNPTVVSSVGNTGATIKGSNWLMELDYLTGSSRNVPFLDLSRDLKLDNADRLKNGSGVPILTHAGVPVGEFISNGVMSQPILVRLSSLNTTLFNQNPDISAPNTTVTTPVVTNTGGVAGGHFDEDIYYGSASTNCGGNCKSKDHVHQYDDKYNVTGVNMLNASNAVDNLSNAIPLKTTPFKVLAQNQYLSPAVKIHIGNPAYLYNVNLGYISIKNFVTSATLTVANLPTYSLDKTAANYVGSLAINMPADALMPPKDWWGNGDVRAGLHPTVTGCVKESAGSNDGNMYQPIIPPANGTDGPGTKGWSNSTTPATAKGVRHNGALVIQIIKASTPQDAIEISLDGRPEYGWRVKSAFYDAYVLAEYTTFWHHKPDFCYGDAGWKKGPLTDTSSNSSEISKATGSTDPNLGITSTDASNCEATNISQPLVTGNVSTVTITYCDNKTATIVTTINPNGTKTIVTTDTTGKVTTEIIANPDGTAKKGGDESGLTNRTGRLSWQQLIKP
jgi:Neisseria PilC beta-propeller domain